LGGGVERGGGQGPAPHRGAGRPLCVHARRVGKFVASALQPGGWPAAVPFGGRSHRRTAAVRGTLVALVVVVSAVVSTHIFYLLFSLSLSSLFFLLCFLFCVSWALTQTACRRLLPRSWRGTASSTVPPRSTGVSSTHAARANGVRPVTLPSVSALLGEQAGGARTPKVPPRLRAASTPLATNGRCGCLPPPRDWPPEVHHPRTSGCGQGTGRATNTRLLGCRSIPLLSGATTTAVRTGAVGHGVGPSEEARAPSPVAGRKSAPSWIGRLLARREACCQP